MANVLHKIIQFLGGMKAPSGGIREKPCSAPRQMIMRSRERVYVVLGFVCVLTVLLVARVFELSYWQSPDLVKPNLKFERIISKAERLAPMDGTDQARANIYDRHGHLMATSLSAFSVYVDPQKVMNPDETAKRLIEVMPYLSYGDVLQKLQRDRRFVWLDRMISPKLMFEINSLGLPGIDFVEEEKRVYPAGRLASHVVGYTNIDNKGMMSLERHFNSLLSENNISVTSSIDIRLQNVMRRELSKAMQRFEAIGAAGLIMDVNNGEIMSMVSLPDFDPHKPGKSPMRHQFNRITKGVYELGSIFKVITTAAALEYTNYDVNAMISTTKPIKRAGFTIQDFHAQKRPLNVAETMIHSSNIGAALLAESVGTERTLSLYAELGLMDPISLEMGSTARPLMPAPWRDINTITAAYGHGMAVTPLQAAKAMATVVNGGYNVTPTVIKRPKNQKIKKGKRIFSEKNSELIRQMMRLTVVNGTGSKADVAGYRVGGKTGTAEKVNASGYDSDSLLSSFVGVFPIDNPKYLIMVSIDEPQGQDFSAGYATGGWTAAPVVSKVISEMAPLYDIKPRSDRHYVVKALDKLNIKHSEEGTLASY